MSFVLTRETVRGLARPSAVRGRRIQGAVHAARTAWLAAVIAVASTLSMAPGAGAACHSFTVAASPGQAAEGTTVTVTVKRDAGVAPSRVDVATVDESARAGEDFTALNQTVSFTNETQQTFSVPILDDAADEPLETFRVHLSNPGGCAVNPSLEVGPDASVTIEDNDEAPVSSSTSQAAATPPTTAGAAPTTKPASGSRPTTTTTVVAAAVTTTSTTALGTTTGSDTAVARLTDDGGGGGISAGAVVAGIAALGAAGASGYLVYRRRATG